MLRRLPPFGKRSDKALRRLIQTSVKRLNLLHFGTIFTINEGEVPFWDKCFLSSGFLTGLGKFLIIVALSAIGLNSDLKKLVKTGVKPMLLGLMVWVSVAVVSLMVQFLTGQV